MRQQLRLVLFAVGALACASMSWAQEDLPLPGYAVARDVPGAKLLPDAAVEHKVVFDNLAVAENVDDENPMLLAVARYVNTLASHGVPPEKRSIAVVMHRGSTPIILRNEAFRARNDGHDNPNLALIRALHAAGVKLHVCGQAVMAMGIDPDDILPEIQLDLWALTTLIDYQQKGYVKVGG